MRSRALHILSILWLTMGTAMTVKAQTFPADAEKPQSNIKILGNVYGGGDQAAVRGNTNVEINKGLYAGEIFGGGNGALNNDGTVAASADVGSHNDNGTLKEGTGATKVTINGGELIFDDDHPSNHNIYGGGNLACNVASSTNIQMNVGMVTWYTFLSNQTATIPAWYQWYDQAMNPNTQKTPIIALFGAGYGAHTDVAGNTNVNVNIPGTADIHPANGVSFTHAELETIDQIIMRWMPDHRMVGQFISAVHGGGYDGTVGAYDVSTQTIKYDKTSYTSQTNVSITGQPFIYNVYGGGLGSKTGADANGGVNSHVGAVYGATKVDIQGGIINGDVFGGGAGIAGQAVITNPFPGAMGGETVNLPYTYAAQVMRETDVTIDGNSTVIFGNVYGGGDIANTGWYTDGARPAMDGHVEQENKNNAKLDFTTSLNLLGGNILGKVFGGGNGRKKSEVEQYRFIGTVIGSTNVKVDGGKIWGDIYGGGNTGCVFSCEAIATTQGLSARTMAERVIDGSTNVSILSGFVARDIFGGGYGDNPNADRIVLPGDEDRISSADISGNTFVHFKAADLEFEKYWKPREVATQETMGDWDNPEKEVTGKFIDQNSDVEHRNTETDICHNLYGGGNMACTVQGNTMVYMEGAPTAPAEFNSSDYYKDCISNVAKPHFSAFGGGYGVFAVVAGSAYSDINLAYGTGLHSIIGGGMNGPVEGACQMHVGSNPHSLIHHIYGGGYYAPCKNTVLEITSGNILENVFGGSVMGNINSDGIATDIATKTTIGLKAEGEGSSVAIYNADGVLLREYKYEDEQNKISIGGNVYGANDVSGTVNGIAKLTILGGTINGDVFGAGNGDHIGYYVPNELLYNEGKHTNNYFSVVHHEPEAPNGNTYVGRPQTIGGVELTLEGNTTDERVKVLGQVFGGGNSCTIGAWNKTLLETTYFSNPHLVRDDPNYFLGEGKIDMNLGSHISIGRTHSQLTADTDGANYLIDVDGKMENVSGLYMGCSGRHLATQEWSKTDNYYHHYYDTSTAQYWPGFAVYQDNSDTPLTRQEGLLSFLAYMNNILVWSDDVNLNIKNQDNTDADDIWISNFVGGGFRGSMKAKTPAGQFHYTLPRGVTIGHDVIGGAFNTDVVYRIFETSDGHTYTEEDGHYKYLTDVGTMTQADESNTTGDYHHIEYAADGTTPTGIVRFYYDGGMLSELPYGTNKASNDRIDRILKKYSEAVDMPVDRDVNKDFTGTGLNDTKAFNYYKRDALVYLELNNKIEVEYVNGHVHGGNVFGGCFSSGRVEGDIWTDYRCFQEGQQANSEDFNLSDQNFNNAKDFDTNFSMMLFGAGYGANTNIQGSAYVRVLHQEENPNSPISGMAYGYPRLYNVFGGSFEGKVEGNTNIYFNPGKYGYVAGAIYGGGCNGYVGGKTYLELAGGYIDEAYGGARNANIGGGTHIWTYDGSARWWGEDVVHASGTAMTEGDAEKAPLFIGKLYGGTDISGQICTDETGNYTKEHGYQPYYTAEFWPEELTTTGTYDPEHPGENLTYIDTYLQVGGIEKSNNGFPIIGEIFAAGNGENTKAFFDAKYAQTNKVKDLYDEAKLPVQKSTLMEVSDGNIIYAFGGGNKATVTYQNYILVRSYLDSKHDIEGLGGRMYDVMKKRILSVGVDCYDEKIVEGQNVLSLKNASIQRIFGGNNIATMAIQPKWSLQSGRINNVYSGGNMGDMTYYNPEGNPATKDGTESGSSGVEFNTDGSNSNYKPRGLSITIDHPEIHIGSLYGGCRLSDVIPGGYDTDGVTPLKKSEFDSCEDYYGATVNISDGYIENVYGGNDISGKVHFGTNVNISGAVSGNVYGSGNGFYLYKWDTDDTQITEHLLSDYDNEAHDKDLCYTVPVTTGLNDTQKLLAINNARPSVEKAFLNIAGLEHYPAGAGNPKRVAYVKGNVYCGGNASTILGDQSFSKFKIGSYVTLNGVFMGSDGYEYTQNEQITKFAKINGFTDMGAATDPTAFPDYSEGTSIDQTHNPILLNVYMMAVDMKAQPKDFNLNLPLKDAYIGTYCGGGNRGSMLVDKMVELPFHHDIIIYDKIVGACLDANITYNQNGTIIKSQGGYSRTVDVANNNGNGNTKIKLDIASQFVPLKMDVPADKLPTTRNKHGETFEQAAAHGFMYDNRTVEEKYTYNEFNSLFQTDYASQEEFEANESEDHIWKEAPAETYAASCNIYGGCYQSGEVEGDIILNLHSNMLRYVNKETLDKAVAYNIACFNVYGAGFGQDSHVWGNIHINMDRCLDPSTMGTIGGSTLSDELAQLIGTSSIWNIQNQQYDQTPTGLDCSYPSFNNVFGGGRNGKLIGNSTIEIRNGLVYTDVAGGCYASDMYGSTHVIVGYPKYYMANTSGEYLLDRADKWNIQKEDYYGNSVIKQSVKYLKGDLVPNNVYEMIVAKNSENASKFKLVNVAPSTSNDARGWDDVFIKIGKGIYGGGYSLANSTAASAGNITTNKLKADNIDLHPHTFDGRPDYDGNLFTSTEGYGGNSSIMVGDQDHATYTGSERDHIRISTLIAKPVSIPAGSTVIGKFIKESDGSYTHQGNDQPSPDVQYYDLSGDGGVYGDGHLTFCEGFRTADITRYGYAEGTPKHPVLMNTFQRMDLLSVNDCCIMLQGAQDFATDQIDATIYSITRINEIRLKSSLNAQDKLGEISDPHGVGGVGSEFNNKQQRNYLAFFNNVHYLGAIVTNDKFDATEHTFHNEAGVLGSMSYRNKKLAYINEYNNSDPDANGNKTAAATTTFKQRNVGTARNAIGINNGYCLRIQNQEYTGTGDAKQSKTYYGPVVGVCEVKLLTLVQGEGGGYVYADNIHEYATSSATEEQGENHFLMTSGNFVFPGIVGTNGDGNQYIVDDCFLDHFGTTNFITKRDDSHPLDEAHYWYVEGNKYFFTTTLTAFTYQEALDFNLIENDPNIILSGMQNGSTLNVKKIEWISGHRANYEAVLPNDEITPEKISDYEFDIEIGGHNFEGDDADWHADMPRFNKGAIDPVHPENYMTTGLSVKNNHLPQFNIKLQDKLDNSGDDKYVNHLDEPEIVKIYLEGKTRDDLGNEQTYEYTITLNIVYLQGPTFEGGVNINNCALPGEWIGFSSDGLKVKTPELMPITAASWQLVPLKEIDEHGVWHWDIANGIVIPTANYTENADGNIEGHIPALYKQNEYNIAYIFTAGGHDFPVMPDQTNKKKENRMIVVHNYHRMKDVFDGLTGARGIPNMQIETMPVVPNNSTEDEAVYHVQPAEAKLYIEDENDLRAFVNYLNMATQDNANHIPVGLTGLDIILQNDITLTSALPTISQAFAGTFHGDGYHIDLNGKQTSLFSDKLTGKVYNLGVIGKTAQNAPNATIATTGTVTNSFVYEDLDADDAKYGKKAYQLSHAFNPITDHNDYADYVANRFANGDYQYATTDRVWSLRTDAPHYGFVESHHNKEHTHDAARWDDEDKVFKPLYDGTKYVADEENIVGTDRVTYHGLPSGYANDYLFFGQHLDKENADAYPMHIEPIANGDADTSKGGNRVFETAGYYQSKDIQRLYYNKDAWALKPTLTALNFTSMTEEPDSANPLPTKFSVDSNKDYGSYNNANKGHVSQNLLVYHDDSDDAKSVFADGTYVDNTQESAIEYHGIIGSGSPATYSINYLHLVDKQNFNAPIAFSVSNRAWYERVPQNFRNVSGNGESYATPSAWEGICLPFTATKVIASENREISHFYGNNATETIDGIDYDISELHHEYWLNGLTGYTSGSATATFMRPAKEGTGLFTAASHQIASDPGYTYSANTYFTSLSQYITDSNTREDVQWYKKAHTFKDYVYLTASVPYIISFPGNDFYEFSLEGTDYDLSTHSKSGEPQTITFESGATTINVSDNDFKQTEVGSAKHVGTYMHTTNVLGMNNTGSKFESNNDALPFRTFMKGSGDPQTRSILIMDPYLADLMEEENNKPQDELGDNYFRIWSEDMEIVVETSKACDLRVYTADGLLRDLLHCQNGKNRFKMKVSGIYIVGRSKLYLK